MFFIPSAAAESYEGENSKTLDSAPAELVERTALQSCSSMSCLCFRSLGFRKKKRMLSVCSAMRSFLCLTPSPSPVGERSVTRTGQSLRGTATGRTFGGAAAPVMEEPGLQWRQR